MEALASCPRFLFLARAGPRAPREAKVEGQSPNKAFVDKLAQLFILGDMNGRIGMKYALMISGALLMALGHGQPASAQSPGDLVKQSVDALGGANALRGLKTMVLKGDAK